MPTILNCSHLPLIIAPMLSPNRNLLASAKASLISTSWPRPGSR